MEDKDVVMKPVSLSLVGFLLKELARHEAVPGYLPSCYFPTLEQPRT